MTTDDLSRFSTQLRDERIHLAEDLDLLSRGVLDLDSLAVGYQPWRDPVLVEVHNAAGDLVARRYSHNLRTNAGGDWQASQMAGTPGAAASYMAVAIDSVAPANTDTFLGGTGSNTNTELTTGGLARGLGTFSHAAISTTGAANVTNPGTYTLARTWTVQQGFSFTGVNKCGIWTAPTGGVLVLENTFSPVNLNPGDTLTLQYAVTY
jgi:hypothetical protein